jgi:hypothetical protein
VHTEACTDGFGDDVAAELVGTFSHADKTAPGRS